MQSAVKVWLEKRRGRWSRFDRVSLVAAVICGSGVLAIAAMIASFAGFTFVYLLFAMFAAWIAALVCWALRRVLFGKLPAGDDPRFRGWLVTLTVTWAAVKLGLVAASFYLWIGVLIAAVLRLDVEPFIIGALLPMLVPPTGNFLLSCALNLGLAFRGNAARLSATADI